MVSDEARAEMPCDPWEERIIASVPVTELPEVARKLMRPLAVVKRLRRGVERRRVCGRCHHYGQVAGTCGIEIDGLARAGEEWTNTRRRAPHERCEHGLT